MAIGIVFAKARDLADWVGRLAVGDDFTEYVLPHLRDLSKMTGIAYAGWVLVVIGIASLIWINAGHRLSDWWRARGALKRDPPMSKPADALSALSQPATVAVKGSQGLAILGLEEKVQPSRSDPPKVTLATYVNIKNTSTVTVPACKCTISYKELSLKGTVTNRVIGPLTLAAGEAKSIPVGAISRYRSIIIWRGNLDGLIQYQVTVTLYGDTHPHSAHYKMYVENKRLVVHRL